jgi:hypothetical protein
MDQKRVGAPGRRFARYDRRLRERKPDPDSEQPRRNPCSAGREAGVIFIDENGEGPGVRLKKRGR